MVLVKNRYLALVKRLLETQIWLILTHKTEPLERSFANKLRAYFSRMQRDVVGFYKRNSELKYDDKRWLGELLKIFNEEAMKSLRLGVRRAEHEKKYLHKMDLGYLVEQYFDEEMLRWISSINETTKKKLLERIKRGVSEGLSVGEIAAELNDMFDSFKGARSLVIARTETARAANYAYMLAMKEAGFVKKKYITALDEYVCPICRELNGKVVAIGDTFSVVVDGKSWSAPYPPLHPNCRCTIVTIKGKDRVEKVDLSSVLTNNTGKLEKVSNELRAAVKVDEQKSDLLDVAINKVVDEGRIKKIYFDDLDDAFVFDKDESLLKLSDRYSGLVREALLDGISTALQYKNGAEDERVASIGKKFYKKFLIRLLADIDKEIGRIKEKIKSGEYDGSDVRSRLNRLNEMKAAVKKAIKDAVFAVEDDLVNLVLLRNVDKTLYELLKNGISGWKSLMTEAFKLYFFGESDSDILDFVMEVLGED